MIYKIYSNPFVNGEIFYFVLLSDVLIHAVPVVFAALPTISRGYYGLFVPIPTLPLTYNLEPVLNHYKLLAFFVNDVVVS